jgi:hypothetical protein
LVEHELCERIIAPSLIQVCPSYTDISAEIIGTEDDGIETEEVRGTMHIECGVENSRHVEQRSRTLDPNHEPRCLTITIGATMRRKKSNYRIRDAIRTVRRAEGVPDRGEILH